MGTDFKPLPLPYSQYQADSDNSNSEDIAGANITIRRARIELPNNDWINRIERTSNSGFNSEPNYMDTTIEHGEQTIKVSADTNKQDISVGVQDSPGVTREYKYSNDNGDVRYSYNDGKDTKYISKDEFLNGVNTIMDADQQSWTTQLKPLLPASTKPTGISSFNIPPKGTTKITTDGVCAVVQDSSGKNLGSFCDQEVAPPMKDGKSTPPVNTEKLKAEKTTLTGAGSTTSAYDVKRIKSLKDSLPPKVLESIAEAAQGGAILIIKDVGRQSDHPIQQHFGYAKPVDKINPQLRH